MTYRPTPGDRIRIERELTDTQLAALAELCRDIGVPRDRWHRVDAVYRVFAAAAAWGLIRRLEAAGRTRDAAMTVADTRLGIPRTTLDSWSRRWSDSALRPVAEGVDA